VKTTEPLLNLQNLSVAYGAADQLQYVVRDVSIKVENSEIVGLIGESGSGKTTTAHALLGLIEGIPGITAGEGVFLGAPCLPQANLYIQQKGSALKKRRIAYQSAHKKLLKSHLGHTLTSIFQEPKSALNPFWNIGKHLLEAAKIGLSGKMDEDSRPDQIQAISLRTLASVGIAEGESVLKQYPHQLSGGLAQRIMIAMALLCRPRLLIADEPTTALDVTTQAKLLQIFTKLRKERGTSILIITHDIGIVREIADRVYVMLKGEIVEQGPTHQILTAPQHPYTQKLVSAFYRFADLGEPND